MKKEKHIHDLETLEKEIYRLELEDRNIEAKLENSFEYLQRNYSSVLLNSFSCKKKHEREKKNGFLSSFFKNENFNGAIDKVTDHIVSRAADGIDSLIDKIFHNRK